MARIADQRTARIARERLTWCYLCGRDLPARRSLDWNGAVQREHVVPLSILRIVQCPRHSGWPLALDVHKSCDKELKRDADQLTKVLSAINGTSSSLWNAGDVSQFHAHFRLSLGDTSHGPVPLMQDTDKGMVAVAYWIRGCHAALYDDRSLCPSVHDIFVRPPGLGFVWKHGADIDALTEHEAEHSRVALELMRHAIRASRVDEIVAWSGHLHFRCVWYDTGVATRQYMCLWTLDIPGSKEWSVSTRGTQSPWFGWFWSPRLPREATTFSNRHLRQSNARYLIQRLLRASQLTATGYTSNLQPWFVLPCDGDDYVYDTGRE